MSFLVDLLAVAVIGSSVVLVAFVLARRVVRRRWRSVRGHPITRGLFATVSLAAAWKEQVGALVAPETLSRGPAVRVRHRMWIAVHDAETAVQHAQTVDAPVAELPAVCRSLHSVATQLDQLLRLERRLPLTHGRPDSVRSQVADVIHAARGIQLAALRASSDATAPQVHALLRSASDEVEIVAATLQRLRSLS